MPTKPKSQPNLAAVHARLRAILQKYERGSLKANPNKPDVYWLVGPPTERSQGKGVDFGGVQTRKNYVSFYLMTVYVFPDLLEGLSPELKKRMQGKSCFNFKTVDETLFKELVKLTDIGYQRFKREKLIGG